MGILHSLTGTMASTESPVIDATLLAIEEINERGGILGREIQPVVIDGASDERAFARQAAALIAEAKVCVIFGCWTSASRKSVRPIVEQRDHLLIYPTQYEGMEQCSNIFYTGAAPNQQIIPAVSWAVGFLRKKRFFLVGWNSVYSRAANAIIRDEVEACGGEIVGEEYVLPDSTEVTRVVRRIAQTEPGSHFQFAGRRHEPVLYALAARRGNHARENPDRLFQCRRNRVAESVGKRNRGRLRRLELLSELGPAGEPRICKEVSFSLWPPTRGCRHHGGRIFRECTSGRKPHTRPIPMTWRRSAGRCRTRALKLLADGFESMQRINTPGRRCAWAGSSRAGSSKSCGVPKSRSARNPIPASRSPAAWEDFLNKLYKAWGGNWTGFAKRHFRGGRLPFGRMIEAWRLVWLNTLSAAWLNCGAIP